MDFEDACVGPSIIDVACCLVGNCFETNPDNHSIAFNVNLMKAFIVGYCKAVKEQDVSTVDLEVVRKEFAALPEVLSAALMLNAR